MVARIKPPNCFRELRDRGYRYHVFMSWPHTISRHGEALVKQLVEDLRDRFRDHGGGDVFFDIDRINPGYRWDSKICRDLCRSGVTIFILIKSFFESDYCSKEWNIVNLLQDRRLPAGREPDATCMLPILLQSKLQLPEQIKATQCYSKLSDVLALGGKPQEHDKWNQIINELVEHVEEVLKLICSVSPEHQNWADEEALAINAGPIEFKWPDAEPLVSPRSPVLPTIVPPGGEL